MVPETLLDDSNDSAFREILDQLTESVSEFEHAGIAASVRIAARRYGRSIEPTHVASYRNRHMRDVNCFHFALGLGLQLDEQLGITIPKSNFVEDLLSRGILRADPIAALAGDMVLYRLNGILTHAGVVRGSLVESKWGNGSVYKHSVFAVPASYGSGISFTPLPSAERVLAELLAYQAPLCAESEKV